MSVLEIGKYNEYHEMAIGDCVLAKIWQYADNSDDDNNHNGND